MPGSIPAAIAVFAVVTLPAIARAQSAGADRSFEFTHNGSFVVSVDDEGELLFARGAARFDAIANDRVQAVLRLDLRPYIARSRIEKKLRSSPELIAAITHAIKLQISAQTGVKDLSLINVPAAVVETQVAAYVEERTTTEALTETTIREVYVRLGVSGNLSRRGRGNLVSLEVGKIEPLHQIDTDFASNPTQGLFYFAVSQPAIRLNGQFNGRTTLYAQASNDRHGAIEDPSGSDGIGFVKDLVARSSGDLLDYSINAYEVGVMQGIGRGLLVAATGERPQRDLLTRSEITDDRYGIAIFKTALSEFDVQLQASVDGAGDAPSINRGNAIVSRSFLGGRAALGTQLFIREGGNRERLVSILGGANYRLIRRENFELGGGAKFSRYRLGDQWDSRAEAGVGFGWSFR